MTDAEVVRALWAAIDQRRWADVERLLTEGFECVFPQSGEVFDRSSWLAMNRHYPGEWSIRLLTIVAAEGRVVTEVEVDIDGRTDRAVSFFTVERERVSRLRELWPEPFEVPEWRAR